MSLYNDLREELLLLYDAGMVEFSSQVLDQYEAVGLWQVDNIKKTVKLAREMAKAIEPEDHIMDIITVSALLHDVCRYEILEDGEIYKDPYGAIKVRGETVKFQHEIGNDKFDAIMRLIETQDGFHSVIPQIEPNINSPAHFWILPFAKNIIEELNISKKGE